MYIIAMLTMLIDHIGAVFFPEQLVFRMIGRAAMPIYAFGIVQGFRHTSSFKRYIIRLVALAGISQLPYMLVINAGQINIIGTFIVSLFILKLLTVKQSVWWRLLLVGAAALLLEVLPFEYGGYALLLIIIFHYAKHELVLHFVLNALYFPLRPLQIFSIMGTSVIKIGFLDQIRVPRWLWRSFYPAHLALLAIAA